MSFKVGDLVVLTGCREYAYEHIDPDHKLNIHIGKIFKIGYMMQLTGDRTWQCELYKDNNFIMSVRFDQIVPARIAKTEIYKALVGDYEV